MCSFCKQRIVKDMARQRKKTTFVVSLPLLVLTHERWLDILIDIFSSEWKIEFILFVALHYILLIFFPFHLIFNIFLELRVLVEKPLRESISNGSIFQLKLDQIPRKLIVDNIEIQLTQILLTISFIINIDKPMFSSFAIALTLLRG